MNDRYLFKAKIIGATTGIEELDWAIGNLIVEQRTGRHFIVDLSHFSSTTTKFVDIVIEVDPSTICQCTGLKDKNGKLIFENDVVEMYDENIDYKWRAVAMFGNPSCEYTWGWQLIPIGKCEVNTDILCWAEMEESGAFCEVIGNIFDNQELLER